MYSPESEDSFLQMAIYVLLEATRHSADYQRNIFDQPLTECKFRVSISDYGNAYLRKVIDVFIVNDIIIIIIIISDMKECIKIWNCYI